MAPEEQSTYAQLIVWSKRFLVASKNLHQKPLCSLAAKRPRPATVTVERRPALKQKMRFIQQSNLEKHFESAFSIPKKKHLKMSIDRA